MQQPDFPSLVTPYQRRIRNAALLILGLALALSWLTHTRYGAETFLQIAFFYSAVYALLRDKTRRLVSFALALGFSTSVATALWAYTDATLFLLVPAVCFGLVCLGTLLAFAPLMRFVLRPFSQTLLMTSLVHAVVELGGAPAGTFSLDQNGMEFQRQHPIPTTSIDAVLINLTLLSLYQHFQKTYPILFPFLTPATYHHSGTAHDTLSLLSWTPQ